MFNYEKLMEMARKVSKNAYAPYSKFPVGAAVLFDSGNVYGGVNVENISYGLSTCAERNAISNALSQGEKGKLAAIAIYSPMQKNCFPCGACRQWLSEFKGQALDILIEDETSCIKVFEITELLPHSFKIN